MKRLTERAQEDRDDFMATYGMGNCSCHVNPPCGSCTHPGNPRNQEEDEDCWEEVFYRVSETFYAAACDEDGYSRGHGTVRVSCEEYVVVKKTPKGVWVRTRGFFHSPQRFVLLTARKKWACPTVEEAIESFKARKMKQKRILQAQIDRVDRALRAPIERP